MEGGGAPEDDHPDPEPALAPRQSARENRGVPPLRFIEMYIASQGEEVRALETVREAMQSSDREKCKEAMKCEMDTLRKHKVFRPVPRLAGKKVVKYKWV